MSFASALQLQHQVETEKGETPDTLVAHPLSWWTSNPLRFDTSGDLMLGFKAPDGRPITEHDYKLEEKVTTLGVIAGYTIVQTLTTIHPGPRVIAAGFAADDGSSGEWKDLLVGSGDLHGFERIYALHFDPGGVIRETNAAVYGAGPNAILGSYDPDTGNGGGCWDGYWWFDDVGPHAVDFSPLDKAVSQAIPSTATFTPNCSSLHPERFELHSRVQRRDAECHACGDLGEVRATYRIERGVAKAVSVSFGETPP